MILSIFIRMKNDIGPLQIHLDNPDINEVMVVDGKEIYIEDVAGIRH